jgi:hypothetical protein
LYLKFIKNTTIIVQISMLSWTLSFENGEVLHLL